LQKIRTVELDGKTVKLQIVSDLNVEMALMWLYSMSVFQSW
jgi:hypothetical protein